MLCGEGEREGDPWTADHIVPRRDGGSDGIDNLQRAHRSCNSSRGARMPRSRRKKEKRWG